MGEGTAPAECYYLYPGIQDMLAQVVPGTSWWSPRVIQHEENVATIEWDTRWPPDWDVEGTGLITFIPGTEPPD